MPGALPKPQACVFDLDGTLVDSMRDIADAFNWCLELLGLSARPVPAYRYLVGEGVPRLCSRAIGRTHPHLVRRLSELARPVYRAQLTRHTRPYSGISEAVDRLRGAGVKLGVLSNKPHNATVRVVEAFWAPGCFDVVQGFVEEHLRKPSPHYLLRLCERMGVLPERTWMVGDTPTDVATAQAAGVVGIGVTWGFRTRDDLLAAEAQYIVDHPSQLVWE